MFDPSRCRVEHMSLRQAAVCTVLRHDWGPVTSHVTGAQRTCARCGRNQLVDLSDRPIRGVVPGERPDNGAG